MLHCRAKDRKGYLFSKKKNLYDPSPVTREMVTLRSVSPETEEAKKKELEASSELEPTTPPLPVPVPQTEGEESSLWLVEIHRLPYNKIIKSSLQKKT